MTNLNELVEAKPQKPKVDEIKTLLLKRVDSHEHHDMSALNNEETVYEQPKNLIEKIQKRIANNELWFSLEFCKIEILIK